MCWLLVCSPFSRLLPVVILFAAVTTAFSQITLQASSNSTGNFSSPGYPLQYPPNVKYNWLIIADVGFVVHITVTELQIVYQETCNDDSLTVYDATNANLYNFLAQLCGPSPGDVFTPRHYYSTGRYLYLAFKSDSRNQSAGFTIGYTAQSSTGLITSTMELQAYRFAPRYLFSPGYLAGSYPANVSWSWRITADIGFRIQLEVEDVHLQNFLSRCQNDNLTIYNTNTSDPRRILASLCIAHGREYNSADRHLYLIFKTDGTGQGIGTGFRLSYKEVLSSDVDAITLAACAGRGFGEVILEAEWLTKYIQSPNYPDNYTNNADCAWTIRARNGYIIYIQVRAMDLERSVDCYKDSVTLYDNQYENQHFKIAKLCSLNSTNYYSSDNFLMVTFRSDTRNTAPGFRLVYEAVSKQQRQLPAFNEPDSPSFMPSPTVASPKGQQWLSVQSAIISVVSVLSAAALVVIGLLIRRSRRARNARAASARPATPYALPSCPPSDWDCQASHPGPGAGNGADSRVDISGAHDNSAYVGTESHSPPAYTKLAFGSQGSNSEHLYLPRDSSGETAGPGCESFWPPPTYEEISSRSCYKASPSFSVESGVRVGPERGPESGCTALSPKPTQTFV